MPCCPAESSLRGKQLVSPEQADELMVLFKTLANGTRLRVLHALLRAGEMSVTALADAVEMKPQATSNQLQRLADRGIVASRRDGNNIYYRIVDPCVVTLFDRAMCLVEETKRRMARGGAKK